MFSVTNSGSSSSADSGDQLNSTASATPTRAPRQKPPRISAAVTARLESQAYLAEPSVASAASGEGSMNFGTWKASTRTCQSTITARCTIRMIANDRAERVPSPRATSLAPKVTAPHAQTGATMHVAGRGTNLARSHPPLSTIWLIRAAATASPGRPHACGGRAGRPGCERSVPKIADRVGVLEKKK